MTISIRLVAAACLWLLLLPAAFSQTQSQLTGTITDHTRRGGGGRRRDRPQHRNRRAVQDRHQPERGLRCCPFFRPGSYELACELAGFKKFVRCGLVLETGSTATVDVSLELGPAHRNRDRAGPSRR